MDDLFSTVVMGGFGLMIVFLIGLIGDHLINGPKRQKALEAKQAAVARIIAKYSLKEIHFAGMIEAKNGQYVGFNNGDKYFIITDLSKTRKIKFDRITEVTLSENGHTLQKVSGQRGRSLTGAIVGGLAFGGAGAIVGAMGGRTPDSTFVADQVSSINVLVLLNIPDLPILDFQIISLPAGVPATSAAIIQFRQLALVLSAHFKQAMSAEAETSSVDRPAPDLDSQLRRLWALKEEGILSAEEFAHQKSLLLAA